MKIQKLALLAAAVAALSGPIADVHAATETSVNFVLPGDTGATGDLRLFFDFTNTPDGDWASGDDFVDQFVFNVPESAAISFTTAAAADAAGPQVAFSGFRLTAANGDPVSYAFGSSSVAGSSMSASGLTLQTGTYDLQLSGIFLASDAAYGGTIVATSAIPEPGAWLLLAAGLGAITVAARRRPLRPARVAAGD
jgi:hypothetical protein